MVKIDNFSNFSLFLWLDRARWELSFKHVAERSVISTETYRVQKILWCLLLSELIDDTFYHTCHDTSQVIITQFTRNRTLQRLFFWVVNASKRGAKDNGLSSLFLCASSIRKMTALRHDFRQISIFKWYSKQRYLKVTENTYPFRI